MRGALALAICLGALLAGPASANAPAQSRLGVVATEWSLTLSRASVRPSTLVELSNFGEDDHNLWLKRGSSIIRIPRTRPGEHVRRRVHLARGRWTLYCQLPGHAKLGMRTTLRVR